MSLRSTILALTAFFLITMITSLSERAMAASQIKVNHVEVYVKNKNHAPDQLKHLIPFQDGDTVNITELKERLQKIEEMDSIQKASYQFKGGNLIITIYARKLIRDIKVSGNFPFLEKQIRSSLSLIPGTPYEESALENAKTSLIRFYQKKGYYETQVEISAKPHKRFDTVDIIVNIEKGRSYKIKTVHSEGNSVFTDKKIRGMISGKRRYREPKVKESLKKIKSKYADRGYIKAKVRQTDVKLDDETETAEITLLIKENKKLILKFSGKPIYSKRKLSEILDFKTSRSYDSYSVKLATEKLIKAYKKDGYADIQIKTETEKTDDTITIDFIITPGREAYIEDFIFDGADELSKNNLKEALKEAGLFSKNLFQEKDIEASILAIHEAYANEGYLDAQIEDPVITTLPLRNEKVIYYKIHEGEQYHTGEITYEIDSETDEVNVETVRKVLGLKSNKVFQFKKVKKAREKLSRWVLAFGYPYAEVELDLVKNEDTRKIDLPLSIKLGEKAHIRNISVTGHSETRLNVILKAIKIKSGDLFVYEKMLNAQLALRRFGIFSSVRITPLGFEEKKQEIDLLIQLQERKPVLTSLQVGIDNRNFIRGEASLTKRNLFGTGTQLSFRVIGGPKFNRGEITFFSPTVFGERINFVNQVFAQYEDAPNFEATSYGGFFSFYKNFGTKISLGLKNQITRTEVDEAGSNIAALGNALFDNTFNELQIYAIFDTRNNFSDPTKGFYALISNEFNYDISDPGNQFNTLELNVNHFQKIMGPLTLTNTVRYGQIFNITNNPRVPVNKLFFQGGADTLRGFTEDGVNPSGGRVSLIYNAELALKLTDSVKVAAFFDAGFLSDSINQIELSSFRETAGLGLRYLTPLGPVRLDVGTILDKRPGDPNYRITFSFGYFF
jgi:outer membrane protein insertion porin family